MQAIEYITEMSPNGKFQIPLEFLKENHLDKNTKVKILLLFEEKKDKRNLNRFCGKWQDDRDVDELILEIYESRKGNIRSDRIKI